jgi:hypothetical protein
LARQRRQDLIVTHFRNQPMKAGFDSHERAFQHRQLAFQVVKASTFELPRDGCNVACSLIGAPGCSGYTLITALIGDDSSIRHRNIALAPCPRADE